MPDFMEPCFYQGTRRKDQGLLVDHGLRERRRAFRRALAALRACGLSLLLGGLPLLCWWLGTFMLPLVALLFPIEALLQQYRR